MPGALVGVARRRVRVIVSSDASTLRALPSNGLISSTALGKSMRQHRTDDLDRITVQADIDHQPVQFVA